MNDKASSVFSINGREVSVTFSEQKNDSVYNRVRSILLTSFVNNISADKLANGRDMSDNIYGEPCKLNNCHSQLL